MATTEPTEHYAAKDWSAYVDSELPPAQQEAMRVHLQRCPQCAALARSFEAVQRGAEELARQAEPPPVTLRPKLLAVGLSVLRRSRRYRWWGLAAATVVVAVVAVSIFTFLNRSTTPTLMPPPSLSLDRVHITKLFVYPPSLDYEVTVRNNTDSALVIRRVITSDPFGKTQRPVEPPVRIEPRQVVQWRYPRLVTEDAVLLPGQYRITLITDSGTLSAERSVQETRKP